QRAASLGKKGVLREIAAYDKDVIATNFPGTASLPAGLRKFAGKLADAVATPEVKAAIEEGSVTDDSIIKLFELSSDSLRNPVELTKAFASMTTDLEKLRGAVNTTLEDKEKDKAEEIMDGVGQLLGKISAYIANGIANNYESGRRRGR